MCGRPNSGVHFRSGVGSRPSVTRSRPQIPAGGGQARSIGPVGDKVIGNDKAMWVRVVAVAGAAAWTAMTLAFGFGLVLTVLEPAGPKDTSQALVLERSAFEWVRNTCDGPVGGSRGVNFGPC